MNKPKFNIILGVFVIFIGIAVNAIGPTTVLVAMGQGEAAYLAIENLFPWTGLLIIASGIYICLFNRLNSIFLSGPPRIPLFDELDQAIRRVSEEPNRVKPTWDLARIKLELYFDRNLNQINYIFWLSVSVMIIGFIFILYGMSVAINPRQVVDSTLQSDSITPSVIGAVAGIITEFIGATFLFLYRATIQQAGTYVKTLERINSVGMAMQILDSISSDSVSLKDSTKAEIVKSLLEETKNQEITK